MKSATSGVFAWVTVAGLALLAVVRFALYGLSNTAGQGPTVLDVCIVAGSGLCAASAALRHRGEQPPTRMVAFAALAFLLMVMAVLAFRRLIG